METPTIQQIADEVGTSKNSIDNPPTHPTDTIFFHGENYSLKEMKDHILQQTNIGRLYVAEYIGQAKQLADERESC